MDSIILNISAFFSDVMGLVSKVGFGPTGSIAWATIFLAIGVIRMAGVWKDLNTEGGIAMGAVQVARTYAKVAWVWFLIAGSPYIFNGIAGTVQGNVQQAATGSIAQQGQGLFNDMTSNVRTLWSLRAVSMSQIWDSLPSAFTSILPFQPSRTDAFNGLAGAQTLYEANKEKWNKQLAARDATAAALLKSSNPKDRASGRFLQDLSTRQRNDLQQADTNISIGIIKFGGNDKPPDLTGLIGKIGATSIPIIGALNLGLLACCFLLSLLVVGPSLVLAVSATIKVLQSMVEIFTFLFGFAAMVVVVAAFAVVLGPLAMMSFISDHWSRYGWNFVSFWIQALVASVAIVVLVGIAGTAIGSIGGYMSQAAILVVGNALGDGSPFEIALKCVMGGLLFLGMGAALTFISTFLQRALSGTTGMVHGTLHP